MVLKEFTYVDSSNLQGVRYDPETQVLGVQFKSGSTYEYDDVPIEEYEGLMAASSKGSYFNSNIKDGYTYRQV